MSLPILWNRWGAPVQMRIVLGAALLLSGLSGCARGPHGSFVSQWGHKPARTTTLEGPTLQKGNPASEDEVVGHVRVHGSVVVRSGNVFAALVNRRHPKGELSDDPFLNDFLADAETDGSGLIEQKITPARPAETVESSSIREVGAKTVQTPPPRPQHRHEPAAWPSVEKPALVADRNQMSRLRTAMKSDDHRDVPSNQPDAHATKVHVGRLMQDVHALRQKGKLSEAYQTALSAKKLAKTSRLFYGPDEEQPGDLVHQLRRELRAAGYEATAEMPSSSIAQSPSTPSQTTLSQPTDSEPDRSPAERPSQRRSARKTNEKTNGKAAGKKQPLPFLAFVPPKSSLVVARPAERTSRLKQSPSVEQPATTPEEPIPAEAEPATKKPTLADLKQALVHAEEALSERVEILPPAPRPTEAKEYPPSRTIAREPVLSGQPRVLTNSVPVSSIQPVSSDRPLIVPAQQFLPERTEIENQRSFQRHQTAADRIRQASLTANAQPIWNRQEEPAVLMSSLATMPADKSSVRSTSRRPMRSVPNPAPAPPVEFPKSDPAEEALLSSPNPRSGNQRPGLRTAAAKGSALKTVSLGSVDWNDHAGFDDDSSAGVGESLLWLALAVLAGLLVGVLIRVWTRFRGKPIFVGTISDKKSVRDGVICDL